MSHRSNEEDRVHFRSERIFAVNDKWYLQLRDVPEPLGPYGSKPEAERVLAVFLQDLKAGHTVVQALGHLRLIGDTFAEDDF